MLTLLLSIATTLLLLLFTPRILRYLTNLLITIPAPLPSSLSPPPKPTKLIQTLLASLPTSVLLPNTTGFTASQTTYWALQASSSIPSCIVQPRSTEDLCTAVKILRAEFLTSTAGKEKMKGGGVVFAVKGGGHSPVRGAASIKGGVVVDLSLLCEVLVSEDWRSVVIGAGARWGDVSKVLDKKGLAVVGGRNSDVGVGGLSLGGGLSFFTPRYGLVCSNITSYTLVVASGELTTCSSTVNARLFRALKGGSNNFGIITSFTTRTISCSKVWSGFLYLPSFQAQKVLHLFHASVARGSGKEKDECAAGPIASWTYVQQLGIQVVAVNMAYTDLPEIEGKWPDYWGNSGYGKLWRWWSTCKVQTVTSATEELNGTNPRGRRQVMATTTVENDLETLVAVHAVYLDAIQEIKRKGVKGIVWTIVLQPFLPEWVEKGEGNCLGLGGRIGCPHVIVSFTVNWAEERDDGFVEGITKKAVERIDEVARERETGCGYRYLNYCDWWQKPFEGYGDENLKFLREVAREVDPEGLFQKGCVGGFKLGGEEA